MILVNGEVRPDTTGLMEGDTVLIFFRSVELKFIQRTPALPIKDPVYFFKQLLFLFIDFLSLSLSHRLFISGPMQDPYSTSVTVPVKTAWTCMWACIIYS